MIVSCQCLWPSFSLARVPPLGLGQRSLLARLREEPDAFPEPRAAQKSNDSSRGAASSRKCRKSSTGSMKEAARDQENGGKSDESKTDEEGPAP